MNKYEYKIRSEEIKDLIKQGEYVQAAEIADTIDWRRVRNVMMLCMVSDLYKVNRRYEDAKDLLLLAYEHRPGGRNICYALCDLYIKTEDIVQAVEYYKEFVQVAPRDSGRYILLYKIYEAQDVSLEERIEVLKELKKHDYREKWAYELAYLYHRMGQETLCVEECDEMILWFNVGKYVIKAMELKMLHRPLTPEQQEKYDHRFDEVSADESNVGAESADQTQNAQWEQSEQYYDDSVSDGNTQIYEPVQMGGTARDGGAGFETAEAGVQPEELDIQVKTVDVGEYNTINLQAELAQGLREVLDTDPITRSIVAPMMEDDEAHTGTIKPDDEDEDEDAFIFINEKEKLAQIEEQAKAEQAAREAQIEEERAAKAKATEEEKEAARLEARMYAEAASALAGAEPPKEIAHVLSQEADGQISLVLPESGKLEKQITGQMNIQDILTEWEQMKKENEEKRKEEVRQRVKQHTGKMFTEFEMSVRDGLLEKLEHSANNVDDGEREIEEFLRKAELEEKEGIVYKAEPAAEQAYEEPVAAQTEQVYEEPVAMQTEQVYEEPMTAPAETVVTQMEPASTQTYDEATTAQQAEPAVEQVYEEPVAAPAGTVAAQMEPASTQAYDEATTVQQMEPASTQTYNEATTAQQAEPAAEQVYEEPVAMQTEQAYEEPVAAPAETVAAQMESTSTQTEPVAAQTNEPAKVEADEAAKESENVPEKEKVRSMTKEESDLYASYIQSGNTKEQIVKAVDGISLAAYTGNVIITGEEGMDTLTLAKNMIREAQSADSNFAGKIAKISGQALNKKNVEETLNLLQNGALIIQKACDMESKTVQALYKALQRENLGIVVIMEDRKKNMNRFLDRYENLQGVFTARVDVEAMSNDELVAFGKQYAYDQEYSIDDLGMLALHKCIEEQQTIDHAVTAPEVKTIVDDAIHHANRKTPGHFFDILFAKRYDKEDMIVLTERDFA